MRAAILVLFIVLASLTSPASHAMLGAQDGEAGTPAIASGPSSDTTQGPLWGEVTVELRHLGVGDAARPGDWTGILLDVTDSAASQREAVLRVWFRDADRDVVQYERVAALDPGRALPIWVYARLPGWFRQGQLLSVDVFEAVDNTGPDAEAFPVRAGRLIGQAKLPARRVLDRTTGLIGVFGGRSMGLGEFSGQIINGESLALAHELYEVATGMTPEDLPDRPQGLASFSTLVWTDAPPGRLSLERAAALREWVQGGGHLVVVLPRAGQAWTDEVNNPLYDITPRVRVERREDVDLRPWWRLFSPPLVPKVGSATASGEVGPMLPPPSRQIVQTLPSLPEASPGEADVVLALPGPDAAPVVVRRAVGTGAVTLVGFDLTNSAMANAGLPVADVFWHRVLGTRGTYPTAVEMKEATSGLISRESVTLDRGVAAEIAKTGRSAAGVLLGFVLFVVYWLVAGPGGFGILKFKGLTRHAWLAFLAAAGVFTAIAWTGASLLRPKRVEASHLSMITHVYGQKVQRARGWFNLLLPDYGETRVRIGAPGPDNGVAREGPGQPAISPWESLSTTGPEAGFPDARGYRLNATNPITLYSPSRATVKQFQADWVGESIWKMPRPYSDPAADRPDSIRLIAGSGATTAAGRLVHELPGALEDVAVIVCRGQATITGQRGDRLVFLSSAYKLTDAWKPGDPLDLGVVTNTKGASPGGGASTSYFDTLLESFSADGMDGDTADSAIMGRLTASVLAGQLTPPRRDDKSTQTIARRAMTHGWDVSRWFCQPCIVLVGSISNSKQAPSPIPLAVGTRGDAVVTRGRTLVVWVYPLPTAPPGWAESAEAAGGVTPDESTKPIEGPK